MRRSLLRLLASALAVALGACAPARPHGPAAPAQGPYEVPGAAGREAAEQAEAGPIPVLPGDPARGSATAPVTIVEFADFQCPFCQRAAVTLAALQREYGPEKLRVVWKNYPLPFHHDARGASEAAMAILQHGGPSGFWRYHDAIFGAERGLGRVLFDESVGAAGFSPEDVARALRTGAPAHKVNDDERLGRALGVTGTPVFFVNGVLVHGAQPIEKFRAIIDAQLQAARAAAEAGTPPGKIYAQLTARSFVPPAPEPADEEPPPDLTVYRVPVGASPSRGPAGAPVTIVEFADFQCPYCVRAEEPLKEVAARYGDKVRFVWKNMPLPFHKHAEPAAQLAAEAFAQKGAKGFWTAHDLLLAQGGHLDDADLESVAKAAGLDPARASRSVAEHRHRAAIEDDTDLAEDVDATGTPTFFVNGRKLVGAQPFPVLEALIDQQLAVAGAALAKGVAPAALYETLQANAKVAALDTVTVPAPSAASPSRGPSGAKVVVQIWSDFECPYCKRVEPTLAQIEAAFPGKVRVVWHDHPLPFHPHAMAAAQAAAEAFAQKGAPAFWKMHDLLLDNQGDDGQDRAALEKYAAEVGLDLPRFRAALDGETHRAAIVADAKIGEGAGLGGTPGFVINGYRVSGALPLGHFKKVVRRALAEAK
jgi:protein-disulfide isomerase